MKNMYVEMSKGAYTVDGAATPWVKVAHSEAWYGATVCSQDDNGVWAAGAVQSMHGHPDNPLGRRPAPDRRGRRAREADPNFPWEDYDIEDQGDVDGDGNFLEPDGVIDHLVLVHAGEDKSGGGGAQGPYAIWAHSSSVVGGAPIPGTKLKVSNYIVQPEDSGVGVFAHEYGHDLGLPDLYDTASGRRLRRRLLGPDELRLALRPDLPVDADAHGPLGQVGARLGQPGHARPGCRRPRTVNVGQTSRTPKGTADGVKVNLPHQDHHAGRPRTAERTCGTPAPTRPGPTTRSPATSPSRPVRPMPSSGCGTTTSSRRTGTSASSRSRPTVAPPGPSRRCSTTTGAEVSTPDGYADPNGRMVDFGGKKYGLTGTTDGWQHHYVDLTPFAGQNVQLRLRYATDEAFQERGWFADDLSVTAAATTVWSDGAEGGNNGWTADRRLLHRHHRAGWRIDTGTSQRSALLPGGVAQLRRLRRGPQVRLRHHVPARRAWKVEKIRYNAPGHARLVPRHHVRQRQPRADQPDRAAQRGRQGWSAHRGLPLRPAAAHRRGRGEGPVDAEEPAQPAAFVERGVRPAADVPVQGVRRGQRGRHGRGVHELRAPGTR